MTSSDVAAGRIRFVLSGGGAMGAYQAGALLSLLEHGLHPDALYGCSAGALNAAFWPAVRGQLRAGLKADEPRPGQLSLELLALRAVADDDQAGTRQARCSGDHAPQRIRPDQAGRATPSTQIEAQ